MLFQVLLLGLGFTEEVKKNSLYILLTCIGKVKCKNEDYVYQNVEVNSKEADESVNRLVGAMEIDHEKSPFIVAFNMMR